MVLVPLYDFGGHIVGLGHLGLLSGQGDLVVKHPPGNQKVGGSNPTTATW